ncbi:MAG: sigma factor-like helix-turn-helix DNA-binding protein [Patescibacteria group bacterium]|nr:sigma factor-like helix-turn-helix DNA-binding protein [Patescibacteria group bacterium]
MTIKFNPKQISKKLLVDLPERSQDIIIRRYGLDKGAKKNTLDAIGKQYGVTRERVRQIENYSLKNIKKSDNFRSTETEAVLNELVDVINSLGAIVAEDELLNHLSSDKQVQNHLLLLLILGDSFVKEKENTEFKSRWFVDKKLSKDVLTILKKLHKEFDVDKLLPESEVISLVYKNAKLKAQNEEYAKRWLSLSKVIDKNPFDEWGLSKSPDVKVKGIRSHAYLVVRQNGSPMHFKEVANMIQKHFNKKVHVATCHNELIKDERFVLVGRGLYALSEWGYTEGIVRDVIRNILEKEGPLSKDEIIDKVLKERYVKGNTVVVNLQNSDFFKKNKDGLYHIS